MPLITGTSDVNVNIQGYYDRNLLERAVPALIYGRFLQSRPLPKNKGTRINFRRYNSLAANTTALVEASTPTGKKATTTDIYSTVKFYGDFLTYSDVLAMTSLDSTLMEFSEVLGEQMGLTADTLDRDVLVAGTTVRYAAGVAGRSSVATALADSDIKSAIRTLESGNARKIASYIAAGGKIATKPVAPSYFAIGHTDMRQDIEALTGFNPVQEYSSQKGVFEEEIGAKGNVRFLLTTNGKIWTGSDSAAAIGSTGLVSSDSTYVDVYALVILGSNAAGTTPLQAGNVKNIIKKLGSAGADDPLDQRGTSGWKIAKTTKILNDDFMVRVESGVTDL